MLFRSNDTATTEIYTWYDTLSLHDALPIWWVKTFRNPVTARRNSAFLPKGRLYTFPLPRELKQWNVDWCGLVATGKNSP